MERIVYLHDDRVANIESPHGDLYAHVICANAGGSDYVRFVFDHHWGGFDNYSVIWYRDDAPDAYKEYRLDFDKPYCYIPASLCQEVGTLRFSVKALDFVGEDWVIRKLTLEQNAKFQISASGAVDGAPGNDAQMTELEQLIKDSEGLEEKIDNLKQVADSLVSPTVEVEPIENGQKIVITDANGSHDVELYNGEQGAPGAPGEPGEQGLQGEPGAKGDKGDTGPQGEQGEQGEKGEPGDPGKDGVSPTVEIVPIEGGNKVTIKDVDGDHSFNVMNGLSGDGESGSSSYIKGTITNDSDLNRYLEEGIYVSDTPSDVHPTNEPLTATGARFDLTRNTFLIVIAKDEDRIVQILMDPVRFTFVRSYNGRRWSDWGRYTASNNLVAFNIDGSTIIDVNDIPNDGGVYESDGDVTIPELSMFDEHWQMLTYPAWEHPLLVSEYGTVAIKTDGYRWQKILTEDDIHSFTNINYNSLKRSNNNKLNYIAKNSIIEYGKSGYELKNAEGTLPEEAVNDVAAVRIDDVIYDRIDGKYQYYDFQTLKTESGFFYRVGNGDSTLDARWSEWKQLDKEYNEATTKNAGLLPALSGNPNEVLNGEGDWVEIDSGGSSGGVEKVELSIDGITTGQGSDFGQSNNLRYWNKPPKIKVTSDGKETIYYDKYGACITKNDDFEIIFSQVMQSSSLSESYMQSTGGWDGQYTARIYKPSFNISDIENGKRLTIKYGNNTYMLDVPSGGSTSNESYYGTSTTTFFDGDGPMDVRVSYDNLPFGEYDGLMFTLDIMIQWYDGSDTQAYHEAKCMCMPYDFSPGGIKFKTNLENGIVFTYSPKSYSADSVTFTCEATGLGATAALAVMGIGVVKR